MLYGRKSRCLLSDKYSVDRKYNSWMLNLLVHHVTSRLQKVNSKQDGGDFLRNLTRNSKSE
jgi:hypothetical protein